MRQKIESDGKEHLKDRICNITNKADARLFNVGNAGEELSTIKLRCLTIAGVSCHVFSEGV